MARRNARRMGSRTGYFRITWSTSDNRDVLIQRPTLLHFARINPRKHILGCAKIPLPRRPAKMTPVVISFPSENYLPSVLHCTNRILQLVTTMITHPARVSQAECKQLERVKHKAESIPAYSWRNHSAKRYVKFFLSVDVYIFLEMLTEATLMKHELMNGSAPILR